MHRNYSNKVYNTHCYSVGSSYSVDKSTCYMRIVMRINTMNAAKAVYICFTTFDVFNGSVNHLICFESFVANVAE